LFYQISNLVMAPFAEKYIQNNVVYPDFILRKVPENLSVVVMIPCLNEPEIQKTLEALWNCEPIESVCEVIVTVNNSESATNVVKNFNQQTFDKLQVWKKENDRPNLILHPIYTTEVNSKFAGAGMARKIGMDEAIRRFNAIGRSEGIIVSLDADCLVSANYLQRVETVFKENKSCFAATINFRHRIEEVDDLKQKQGIQLYEDYLHYFKKSMEFIGYPNSIHTIGSAFVVRADAYVKQGGMNRRQAGEDFYFLHKLTKLGPITEINDAIVYPSARVSDRVPFGTGASMTKWMNDAEDLDLTYNFAAFLDLKELFTKVDDFFRIKADEIEKLISSFPVSVQEYLRKINFSEKLTEINQNSSSLLSFRKRFFQFFDAFIILRFLNLAHQKYYQQQKLSEAIKQLEKNR